MGHIVQLLLNSSSSSNHDSQTFSHESIESYQLGIEDQFQIEQVITHTHPTYMLLQKEDFASILHRLADLERRCQYTGVGGQPKDLDVEHILYKQMLINYKKALTLDLIRSKPSVSKLVCDFLVDNLEEIESASSQMQVSYKTMVATLRSQLQRYCDHKKRK